MRIYKSLFGDYGPAHIIVWEDVKDAQTGGIIGKAPRIRTVRDNKESTSYSEEE